MYLSYHLFGGIALFRNRTRYQPHIWHLAELYQPYTDTYPIMLYHLQVVQQKSALEQYALVTLINLYKCSKTAFVQRFDMQQTAHR